MSNRMKMLKSISIVIFAIILAGFFLSLFLSWSGDGFIKQWFFDRFVKRVQLEGRMYSILYDWDALTDFLVIVGIVLMVIIGVVIVVIMNRHSRTQAAELANTIKLMKADAERHKQLLELESQRKNDLITYLAHDMRTPLASVMGYLNLLNELPEMPRAQRARYVTVTLDKANKLENLIEEFFDITRFNLQTIIVNREELNLKFLLEQLADEFYPIVESAGKRIEIFTPDRLVLFGDGDKLARVFNNIIKNAISYSYANSIIRIAVTTAKGMVTIRIISQGDPIPPHQREQIFEKFFRLDASRSSETGGAGLGLAIAKEIVDAHHGKIRVISDENTTTFIVLLPMMQ